MTGDTDIGANLKAARLRAVITQDELAHAIGVDRTTITRWEAGQRSMTVINLLHVAQVLGIAPQDLLTPPPESPTPAPDLATVVVQQQAIQTITRMLQQHPSLITIVVQTIHHHMHPNNGTATHSLPEAEGAP